MDSKKLDRVDSILQRKSSKTGPMKAESNSGNQKMTRRNSARFEDPIIQRRLSMGKSFTSRSISGVIDQEDEIKVVPLTERQKRISSQITDLIIDALLFLKQNDEVLSSAISKCEALIRAFTKRGIRRQSTVKKATSLLSLRRSLTAPPPQAVAPGAAPFVIELLNLCEEFPTILLEGVYPIQDIPISEIRTITVFPKQTTNPIRKTVMIPKPQKGTIEYSKQEAAIEANTALHCYGIPQHRNCPRIIFAQLRKALVSGHWSLMERIARRIMVWLDNFQTMIEDLEDSTPQKVAEASTQSFLSQMVDIEVPVPGVPTPGTGGAKRNLAKLLLKAARTVAVNNAFLSPTHKSSNVSDESHHDKLNSSMDSSGGDDSKSSSHRKPSLFSRSISMKKKDTHHIKTEEEEEEEAQIAREARAKFLLSKSESRAAKLEQLQGQPSSLGIVFEYDQMFKCCFVRNFLPLSKDPMLEGASDDKLGSFRAELRMVEDRKSGKHSTADMGDVGCLKGRVHRGAVLVSIDGMSMLGLEHKEILQEVQHARTDNEVHTLRFTHASIHWLIPATKHAELTGLAPTSHPTPQRSALSDTPPTCENNSQKINEPNKQIEKKSVVESNKEKTRVEFEKPISSEEQSVLPSTQDHQSSEEVSMVKIDNLKTFSCPNPSTSSSLLNAIPMHFDDVNMVGSKSISAPIDNHQSTSRIVITNPSGLSNNKGVMVLNRSSSSSSSVSFVTPVSMRTASMPHYHSSSSYHSRSINKNRSNSLPRSHTYIEPEYGSNGCRNDERGLSEQRPSYSPVNDSSGMNDVRMPFTSPHRRRTTNKFKELRATARVSQFTSPSSPSSLSTPSSQLPVPEQTCVLKTVHVVSPTHFETEESKFLSN